ncbi:MAG: hypothetical protein J5546_11455 [Lachnospiraceae bacterium]|nr:hypothetical protein [Lachnospiraceae bacterium]
MKKLLYAMTMIGLLITLCACTNMATLPYGPSSGESAPTETSAPDLNTPAPTPTAEATIAPTDEPTVAPGERADAVPEGFSDEELREKAIREALEVSYAYYSENYVEGDLDPDITNHVEFEGFDCVADESDRIEILYDAEGNARRITYYKGDKEVDNVIRSCFGELSMRSGEKDQSLWEWKLDNRRWYIADDMLCSYVEADAEGRKTVELKEGQKHFYSYDEAGHLACEREYLGDELQKECVYSYDENGRVILEKVYDREGLVVDYERVYEDYSSYESALVRRSDVTSYQKAYEYGATGNLASMTVTTDGREELCTITYSCARDEKGRITGVKLTYYESGKEDDYHLLREFHYFENGPVLTLIKGLEGESVFLDGDATVFLPGTEIKAMLETGEGFSYPTLKKALGRYKSEQERWMPSILSMQYGTQLTDKYCYPEEDGRMLSIISENYLGQISASGDGAYEKLLDEVISQKNYQNSGREVNYSLYDKDRRTSHMIYGGGGGSPYYESITYNSAGQPTKIQYGAGDDSNILISYDNKGAVTKVTYDMQDEYDMSKYKGVVNSRYQGDGKLSDMRAEFTYQYDDGVRKRTIRQIFKLEPYSETE